MQRIVCGIIFLMMIVGCSSKPCRIEDRNETVMAPATDNKDLTKRVFVSKPDGSLQCGMGKKIELITMKKDLDPIEVFSSDSKHDGLMRIQLCGHPTGQNNVYEIAEKDLDQALKLGFKKWLRD